MSGAADCDECVPAVFGPKALFSTLPFVATFVLLTLIAFRKVSPLLVGPKAAQTSTNSYESASQTLARRIAALTFSSTIALSAVLTELLLCEISNSFNPTARSVALQVTVAGLLGLLVVAIPLLGIYSVVSRSGYRLRAETKGRRRLAWALELVGYAVFLFLFWTIGSLLPHTQTIQDTLKDHQNVFQACLDRLGVTGMALMALLSGFASISAIWHNFGPKPKPVSESDINRKRTGLEATLEMIRDKKTRLAQLEHSMTGMPTRSLWSKAVGTFRGDAATREKQCLEMEINGLESMSSSLEASLGILQARRAQQLRSTTTWGRAVLAFQYVFACYCVYRVITTSVNIGRRVLSRMSTSDTDPITYAIALFARHVYPSLDQASWAQQISFLLSGAMLLASFSAVTQTSHLFSRFMPPGLHASRTNFALLISQVSGMYVISSALMLRGMMPKEVGSVINSALGSGMLDPGWVQKWFDGFFMCAVCFTVAGIAVGRAVGTGDATDDVWDGDVEFGKRS